MNARMHARTHARTHALTHAHMEKGQNDEGSQTEHVKLLLTMIKFVSEL